MSGMGGIVCDDPEKRKEEGEPYRGHAGIEKWIRDLGEQFVEWQSRLDDVREVGSAVIAIGGISLCGRAGNVAFDQPMSWVIDLGTDGRIPRARIYLDADAALEVAGLEE